MEIAHVRRQVTRAIENARRAATEHRQNASAAEQGYQAFITDIATPLVRQVANVLKAEGYPFAVHTPSGGLRLTSERSRDDYLEFTLDTDASPPQVTGRVSRGRGSRVTSEERQVKPGAPVESITEEDLLTFVIDVIGPWVER